MELVLELMQTIQKMWTNIELDLLGLIPQSLVRYINGELVPHTRTVSFIDRMDHRLVDVEEQQELAVSAIPLRDVDLWKQLVLLIVLFE